MANSESSDQIPDSPSDDDSGIAAAPPATIPNETVQLQQLLAESKKSEREARRALGVLASIIKHLPVGVTVQAEDGKPLFANDMAAEFSDPAPNLAPNAGEGVEATELARELRPDVAVLDLMLPLRHGLRVLKDIREDPALSHTRVIAITAGDQPEESVLAEGADRILRKPFDPGQLKTAVEELAAA